MDTNKKLEKLNGRIYGLDDEPFTATNCLELYHEGIEIYSQLIFLQNELEKEKNKLKQIELKIKFLKLSKRFNVVWTKWKNIERGYNASIPASANVPMSTIFPHQLANIYISRHAKIGEGCVIFQGVTIGSNTLSDSKNHGSPTIGNNVYIGSGATIVGNIVIGDNVRIGANTTVTKSIESDYTCVSQPSILIKHNGPKRNKQW